ncbi:MAG: response regulator [Cyanobacteria bacterium P01_D01_bin.105]
MQPEEQQRIMGYFIEEAKDHLNTIEQGLLSLQATIEDSEKANEIFRAAHSVKGGAAMLGLESIQRTAHRMEDYFKILKESPVQVDRVLETLFLRISDGLKDLIEQLEGPFGLTQDKAQEIMADVEPVFGQIEAHLGALVGQSSGSLESHAATERVTVISPEAVRARFKRDGASFLRKMLAIFKQPDHAESRKALQDVCTQLYEMGEQFELFAWCDLIETARLATASKDNTYKTLAPILIKEIKQAQDFVLAGRASEIAVSDVMQSLLPEDILEEDAVADNLEGIDDFDLESSLEDSLHGLDFASEEALEDDLDADDSDEAGLLFDDDDGTAEGVSEAGVSESVEKDVIEENTLGDLFSEDALKSTAASELAEDTDEDEGDIERLSLDLDFDEIPSELSALDRDADSQEKADESLDALLATVNVTGPEVGKDELNSLADLFDGDLDELDNTLGSHSFATEEMQLHPERIDISPEDDLKDLLSGEVTEDTIAGNEEIEDDLFGGTLTDGEFAISEALESEALASETSENNESNDFSDDNASLESALGDSVPSKESPLSDDVIDLSKDPWEEDAIDNDATPEKDANTFVNTLTNVPDEENDGTGLGIGIGALDINDEISSSDALASELSEDFSPKNFSPEGLTVSLPEDALSEDLLPEELALEELALEELALEGLALEGNTGLGDAIEISSSSTEEVAPVTTKARPSHVVSPREEDIEFPTLTGGKLQEAEEDIDSFFLGEDESVEQLSDAPWGEISLEADVQETDIGLDEGSLNVPVGDESPEEEKTLEEDSFILDFESAEPGGTSEEKDLEDDFLEIEPVTSFDVNLDVAQAGTELEGLLENEENSTNTDEALSVNEDADDLWGELVSESGGDDDINGGHDDSGIALDLDAELLSDHTEAQDNPEASNHDTDPFADLSFEDLSSEGLSSEDLLAEELGEQVGNTGFSSEDPMAQDSHKDISGDELSEEILADFETAFGTGIFNEAASEKMLDAETIANAEMASEQTIQKPQVSETISTDSAPNSIELSIDSLLEEGIEDELDGFLTEEELAEIDGALPEIENYAEEIDQALEGTVVSSAETTIDHSFDDLDALLLEDSTQDSGANVGDLPTFVGDSSSAIHAMGKGAADEPLGQKDAEDDSFEPKGAEDEDFGDLEKLLEEGTTEKTTTAQRRTPQATARHGGIRDQTMRVSINHLDNLSNLVGELVVSRNTLERDQERLRQFLDNLLFQVQQLNDVGQRMRDLYERSLLESSLMSNRRAHNSARTNSQTTDDPNSFFEDGSSEDGSSEDGSSKDHATGETFDALEMDRFTGFHTLSQEMIELIVRVRESSSDIGYTVESSDQVTRQFRQITTQLQEGLNTARMVAFSQASDRLPRAVRDISLKCGKEARLIVEGQDTLIDKMIVEHLYDPLTHLVNNAITHGIETPEARQAAGKPPEGAITVRAFYQGNQTVIYVADDGGGINTEFVKKKAIEKKLITQSEAEDLSEIETYDLLFHPGFSTRDQADDFAGRGVGMDVVRTSLAEIRGTITTDSEMGKGTSFTIRLPLTLSISKALSCVSNQARIAFPMDGVEDMLDVPRDRIVKNENDQDCVRWRDTLLTFQPVTELLKFNRKLGRSRVYGGSQEDDILSIIVLRSANTYIAVQVDQVIGEQEIVIKQLEGPVPKPLGIAGATVLGDGRVMPIADVMELIDIATGRARREPSSMLWSQDETAAVEETPVKQDPTVLIVDDSITVRELLSMSFNKVGYRVEQARDGQEAWDKLRSGLPCDLVFCDIEMPRMDGLELLSRMQKDNHLKSIPIAMLTSRGADRHRQMAVDLGASGYFTKPYLEEALLDAAQRMLNGETLAKGRGG